MILGVKELDKAESMRKVRFMESLPEIKNGCVDGEKKKKKSADGSRMETDGWHKKTKSSDYSVGGKIQLPSIDEILARILKPDKSRTRSRLEENMNTDRMQPSISPAKIPPIKKKIKAIPKKHYRSSSPLKPFNDRIFQLKRLMAL